MSHSVFRSHNLYLLGAGFSRDAGLPLISDFLDKMRDGVDWIAKHGTREERLAIEAVFQFRHEAASAAHRVKIDVENIEELFSLASASERESGGDDVPRAIAATLRYARSAGKPRTFRVRVRKGTSLAPIWERDSSPGAESHELCSASEYDVFGGILSGVLCEPVEGMRNTIISFNYDTLLEESLMRLDVPFSYELPLMVGAEYRPSAQQIEASLRDATAIRILKPHGSVNWGMNRVLGIAPSVIVHSTYEELLAEGNPPYLLPPTWRKVFSGALASMLTHALDAIRDASRIVIIGSSLPKTDLYFRYLLAGGLKDNISLREVVIVTLGDYTELKANVEDLFQPSVAKRIYWYAKGVQQAMADNMFLEKIDRKLSSRFEGGFTPY